MNVEITAHRGACHDAPENTLAAIELAWRQGADAVEIDIRLCKTGEIVVIHDADTARVAGVQKPVVEQTWEELRQLDVGSWKGARWAGARIPLLAEVLATVPTGKRLQIEVKCGPEILPALRACLREAGKADEQWALSCFNFSTLVEVKRAFPNIPAFWIKNLSKAENAALAPAEIAKQAQSAGFQGVCWGLAEKLSLDVAAICQAAQLKLCAWPVDSVELARRWSRAGAHIITTNRCELLSRARLN